ncbi:CCD17 protein, partial [Geococcyx californianus]|nr:CCD17 protein [Geococcyx californianus]
ALRLSYLRAGGHHPAILAQLFHLQAEATALETAAAGPRKGRRPGKGQTHPRPLSLPLAAEAAPAVPTETPSTGAGGLDAVLLAVELENRRLEDELLALKVRRERRADAGSQAAQRYAEALAQLQAEVRMLQCQADPTGTRLSPAILPPPVAPQLPP